ncbi:hypothetical protein ABK040_000972 [Willaertia magna]
MQQREVANKVFQNLSSQTLEQKGENEEKNNAINNPLFILNREENFGPNVQGLNEEFIGDDWSRENPPERQSTQRATELGVADLSANKDKSLSEDIRG